MSGPADSKKLFFIAASASCAGVLLSETIRTSAAAVIIPLAAAYGAARLVRPAGVFLSRKAHVSPKVGCAVLAVLVCFAAGYAVTELSGAVWERISDAAEYIPSAAESAMNALSEASERIRTTLHLHAETGDSQIGGMLKSAFRETAAGIGQSAADVIKNALSGFPHGIFSLFIGVVSFVYLTADMKGIGESVMSLSAGIFGKERAEKIAQTFENFTDAFFRYLRSYILLGFITFTELSAGFLAAGIESPFAAAFGVAVVDALPLLGCGVVIVPWAIWCFVSGNVRRGVILLVLQIIVYAVRQFAEPKIIGQMTGTHPFVVLAVLFAGLKMGGFTGMILAPVLLIAAVGMIGKKKTHDDS